jgi:hypothetical protein
MNQERGTRGVDEDFFMIVSWTHHGVELECQQTYRTRNVQVLRAYHVESTTGSWTVERKPKSLCDSASSGERAVRYEILHVLREAARERLERHTAWAGGFIHE